MTPQQRDTLVQAALDVRQMAHAPYSSFRVGAALLSAEGHVFTGVNVENVSYGLTNCAERVAIATAVTAGEQEFTGLAVATPGGVTPCGACRQVIAEFCEDLPILIVDSNDRKIVAETTLGALLPGRFHEFHSQPTSRGGSENSEEEGN